LEQVFHDKGVIIDWRAPEGLSFRGERQDLQEMAGNLVENACIWCVKKVRITALTGTKEGTSMPAQGAHPAQVLGQTMTLSIEDDGPGLDASRFDEVLKRGARLDESVPGSGLGLSIVDELVRAYGGRLSFERSLWGGLKAVIVLPAAIDKA
ncbi:MAG: ATP-binding protein, partial [Asticcacaulis sp.]